jgi:hypothetical protein
MRTIAVLLAAALLFSTACQTQRRTTVGPRIDPGLAALVPPGTSILVGADLDALRKTSTYERHFSNVRLPRIDDFARETGLDPRKDISQTLFCSNGRDNGVLMVRGKFSPRDLEQKLEEKGAARTRYKNFDVWGDDRGAVVFLNDHTALLGNPTALRAVVDARGRASGVPKNLEPLLASLPGEAQFWAVFNGTPALLPVPDESNLSNLNHLARSVETGAVSGDLRSGLSLRAHGACATDQDATQIRNTLKGLIGLGRLSTPENRPDLLKVYDAIDVQQQGRRVDVTAEVPQDIVDRFVNTFVNGRRS